MGHAGLARWARAADGGFAMESAMAEMRAHPRFAEGMRQSVAQSVAMFEDDPASRPAMKNPNAQMGAFFALYLAESGGLTLARIQQLCVDLGMMSPGRAVAMLARWRLLRYVELAAEQPDRRKRVYALTASMRWALMRQLHKDVAALAVIEPEAQAVADGFATPEIARKFVIRFGEWLIELMRRYDELRGAADIFPEHEAGLMILNALLLSGGPDDVFPPVGPVRYSIASLARRFGVSRPHVRKLLRDAERRGILRRGGEEGTCLLEPALREDVMHFHTLSFISTAICAHAAISVAKPEHRIGTHHGQSAAADI
jgi:hypothetical protein